MSAALVSPLPAQAVSRDDGSAHVVTFHVGDDDDAPGAAQLELAPIGNGAAVHNAHALRSGRSSARRLRRGESSAVVDVAHITDPDIRAYLDPLHPPVPAATLDQWSEAKLDSLLAAIRSENYPRILNQAEQDGWQARAEPLTFSHLTYTDAAGNARLQDVSGYIVPNEVVGIIAAPDAGASSLLDLLAAPGAKVQGKIGGDIRYNNAAPGKTYKQSVGYISQSDAHMPLLTVEETLFFSARLRLPASISDRMIRFRVRTVLSLLQLSDVRASFVGDEFVKGISGGQKRRLSVGVELTAGHSVLLGDLVTNGLDSATAFDLVKTFRQMGKAGLSIACTVVQAGPELLQLFHRIIVMSKGSIIYSGPPALAEAYFRSIGFRRPRAKSVPQFLEELSAEPEAFFRPHLSRALGPSGGSNAADSTNKRHSLSEPNRSALPPRTFSSEAGVDLDSHFHADSKWLVAARTKKFSAEPHFSLRVERPTETAQAQSVNGAPIVPRPLNQARVAAWQVLNQSYQSSVFYVDVRETMRDLNSSEGDSGANEAKAPNRTPSPASAPKSALTSEVDAASSRWFGTFQSTFWVQFRESFLRQARNFHRSRSTWLYVWVQALVMAFMLGSIFWKEALDETPTGVRNRQGLYFYLIAYCTFNSFGSLPIILGQRPLFYAQTANQFFSPAAYFFSLLAVQVIVLAVELMILLVPVWGLSDLAGFPLSGAFWTAYLVLLTGSLAARFFILFVCYAMPGAIAATTTLTVCFYVFALLAGEFIPKFLSPPGWAWAYNLSFMYWLLKSLVLQDPVDAGVTAQLSGWVPSEESKWTAWEHGLYFTIAFGVAALVTLTWLSWARAALPSAADFVSPTLATHKDDELADDSDQSIGQQELQVGQAIAGEGKPQEAYLEFNNLSYWVNLPSGEEKQLLNGIFGFAKPGRLVALIGKSGAGKSTLLDVLAGKKTGGRIEGVIKVNGVPKDQSQFSRYAAYVEQFDSFAPLNTVRETVFFSGRLRLSPDLSDAELNKKVDRVLDILNLRPAEHSIVGFPGMGGISMELRKKLSIAVEVIAEPLILLLDEPTTGLDSSSAANVMRTVRSLASSITVICTIHQPPTELVANFQDVLLLEEGGRVVYFGDISTLPDFLHQEAGLPQIAPERNVSDYALEVIHQRAQVQAAAVPNAASGDRSPPTAAQVSDESVLLEQGASLRPLSEIFLASKYAGPVHDAMQRGILSKEEIARLSPLLAVPRAKAGFWIQLRELTIRFWQNTNRHRDSLFVRYFFAILFGFIVGTVFCRVGSTQSEGPKKLSIIFFCVGHFMFSASSFFPGIFMNRVLYFREHVGSQMYGALPYFLARFFGDVPHIFAEVFLTTLLVYFVGGLSSDEHSQRYGYFLWANVIIRCTAIFMTVLIASIIAAPDFAFSVLATTMYLCFALCGFFIPVSRIGDWWKWLSHLDFLKYALQFLSITEFRDDKFTCDPMGKDAASMVELTPAQASAFSSVCPGFDSYPSLSTPGNVLKCNVACGFELLDQFGVKHSIEWQVQSFVILHCFMIAFALMGFVALKYINHIKR